MTFPYVRGLQKNIFYIGAPPFQTPCFIMKKIKNNFHTRKNERFHQISMNQTISDNFQKIRNFRIFSDSEKKILPLKVSEINYNHEKIFI